MYEYVTRRQRLENLTITRKINGERKQVKSESKRQNINKGSYGLARSTHRPKARCRKPPYSNYVRDTADCQHNLTTSACRTPLTELGRQVQTPEQTLQLCFLYQETPAHLWSPSPATLEDKLYGTKHGLQRLHSLSRE